MSIDLERASFYVRRLVIIPLILIVVLSWSVFWMERSSLGDRINLSFVGILTAVGDDEEDVQRVVERDNERDLLPPERDLPLISSAGISSRKREG